MALCWAAPFWLVANVLDLMTEVLFMLAMQSFSVMTTLGSLSFIGAAGRPAGRPFPRVIPLVGLSRLVRQQCHQPPVTPFLPDGLHVRGQLGPPRVL